jgi:hypothetical protein
MAFLDEYLLLPSLLDMKLWEASCSLDTTAKRISFHQVLTTYVASHFSWTVFNTLSLIFWVSYSWHTQAVEYASYHPPTLSTEFLCSSISRPYS